MSYHPLKACRLCNETQKLSPVLSVASTPPANAFLRDATASRTSPRYPLSLYLCGACGHVQLGVVVDPKILFDQYLYSSPPGMKPHWAEYAETVGAAARLAPGDLVVEIGANNGDLLREFKARGMRVAGFEPGEALARSANADGLGVEHAFFTKHQAIAWRARRENSAASLVVANNVFAHIEDLHDVVTGVKRLLAPGGLFVFEVQYLRDLVEQGLFDMIYHEHLSYHAVGPLVPFFARHGMKLFHVEHVDTHGGSIRCYVARRGEVPPGDTDSVLCFTRDELKVALRDPDTYRQLGFRVGCARSELVHFIHNAYWSALNGGSAAPAFAGYGAPAKATTLLHEFGLITTQAPCLSYVVDDAPEKHGCFVPGTAIPITPQEHMRKAWPDYVVILAWNYADAIEKKLRAAGFTGKLLIPLPQLEVR